MASFWKCLLLLVCLWHVVDGFLAQLRDDRTVVMMSSLAQTSSMPEAVAPPPYSFASLVEKGIVERFGSEETKRVIESWRWTDMGYEHHEFVGDQQNPPILDRSESQCFQFAPSFVRGLPALAFWDEKQFDWPKYLRSKYPQIRNEFRRVTSNMDRLVRNGNNVWAGALTEDASSYGTGWKTLVLMNRGMWDPVNVNLFPKTAKAVHESGVPAAEVFFASLKPHSDIKFHSDFTNFVLTSHLAIDIPESGNNKCRLTIGDDTRQWINGEVMLFDTSIMHGAVNESDRMRYILMLRIWHPHLTEAERGALQFIFSCLEFPDLVDPDPETRLRAEKQLEQMRAFPTLQKTSASGFGASNNNNNNKGGKKKKTKRKK